MMNAAVDIGNTLVKVGLFKDSDLVETHDLLPGELGEFFSDTKVNDIILSTVKPLSDQIIQEIQQHCKKVIVLIASTPLPISINYKTPETLGMDRLAAAVGTLNYSQNNTLIIDLGTCITYDLLDKHQVFQGGIISPGLEMRLRAMHEFTAELPLVKLKTEQDLIGKTTEECMLSGALNGTRAEINQIIRQYIQQYEGLRVIICGGSAVYFEKELEIDTFVVPHLVLEGLNSILRFNAVD